MQSFTTDHGHPFAQNIVSVHPSCFANRCRELKELARKAGRARVLTIEGPLGSGKSTLIEQFLASGRARVPVVALRLSHDAHEYLFRSMLAAILRHVALAPTKGAICLDPASGFEVERHMRRLDSSLVLELSGGIGLTQTVSLKTETKTGTHTAPHDEHSAREALKELLTACSAPFLVVLDDFHHLRMLDGEQTYLAELTRLMDALSRQLCSPKLTVMVTLDEIAIRHRANLQKERGGIASLGEDNRVSLQRLTLEHVAEMVHRRLRAFERKETLAEFISTPALAGLLAAVDANPRGMLQVLQAATDAVEDEECSLPLGLADIREVAASLGANVDFDDLDCRLLEHLDERQAAATPEIVKALGESNSTVARHIEELSERGLLLVTSEKRGRTTVNVAALPVLDAIYN